MLNSRIAAGCSYETVTDDEALDVLQAKWPGWKV